MSTNNFEILFDTSTMLKRCVMGVQIWQSTSPKIGGKDTY
jgi:hypothetical protein